MIKAILCTTTNNEPWAALVPFEVNDIIWSTKLKTNYQHYKNLEQNPDAVIVFARDDTELIMKSDVELEILSTEETLATLTIKWLRVVSSDGVRDLDTVGEIQEVITAYL